MIFTHSGMNLKDSTFFVQVLGGPRKVGGQKENNVIIRHQTSDIIRHKIWQRASWAGSVRGRVEPKCPLPLPHHRQQDQQGTRHPQCGGQEAWGGVDDCEDVDGEYDNVFDHHHHGCKRLLILSKGAMEHAGQVSHITSRKTQVSSSSRVDHHDQYHLDNHHDHHRYDYHDHDHDYHHHCCLFHHRYDKQALCHPPWFEATLHILLSWAERVLLWQVDHDHDDGGDDGNDDDDHYHTALSSWANTSLTVCMKVVIIIMITILMIIMIMTIIFFLIIILKLMSMMIMMIWSLP